MRVKRGVKARRRRNKVLKQAKGFRGRSSNTIRQATQRVEKALCYSYRDRKARKREFRKLWISRISAAAKENGTSYSKLMNDLKVSGIELDRKVLSEIVVNDPEAFAQIVSASSQN